MTAREAALKSLSAYRQRGAYSSDALKAVSGELDSREAALASQLCFGVLQNMYLIDSAIARFSSVKPAKMEPRVLDILRISAYQLMFLDRIPASAAVNEAVKLTKKYSNQRASGLVNAVLRKISQNADALRNPDIPGGEANRLSVKYSHPEWLVNYYISALGANGAESTLRENNSAVPVYLQTNFVRATVDAVSASLESDGADFSRHPWLDGCFMLNGRPDTLSAFKNGLVYVQDPAAAASIRVAGIAPGSRVLDVCSAPGGKSFAAAIGMQGRGEIISCDIHENKLTRIRSGAERLGLDIITARALDARHAHEVVSPEFDAVICDVPCSGLGIIRKKPEIRYKSDEELKALPKIQLDILKSASKCVRPGGTLIYSTCTVLKRENEDVISSFLKDADFTTEAFVLPPPIGEVSAGYITLWPHIHGTDGFFICKMRKKI